MENISLIKIRKFYSTLIFFLIRNNICDITMSLVSFINNSQVIHKYVSLIYLHSAIIRMNQVLN